MTPAEQLRRACCRAIGLTPDETEESIRDKPPVNADDEARQLEEVLECERDEP